MVRWQWYRACGTCLAKESRQCVNLRWTDNPHSELKFKDRPHQGRARFRRDGRIAGVRPFAREGWSKHVEVPGVSVEGYLRGGI